MANVGAPRAHCYPSGGEGEADIELGTAISPARRLGYLWRPIRRELCLVLSVELYSILSCARTAPYDEFDGGLGALPYLFMAISCLGGGILSDRWISRGASAIRVRRGFVTTGLVMSAVFLPLALLPRVEFAIAGLVISNFAFGIYVSNLWALTQTLAGPLVAGRWTGIQNAFGNLAEF